MEGSALTSEVLRDVVILITHYASSHRVYIVIVYVKTLAEAGLLSLTIALRSAAYLSDN